ncbi:rRNA adenine N-6-methyltransferase family protein [Raoultella ornithinolytica]|uniref:hypothetical protein n=1 Tax=Raoultella ornithinolytica TaxID=54291 RepID=UPI002DBBD9C4|nr:hypothetical protein [Raoultella ornithinolytica]MEB6464506.1 rRNA adenine N-6-methyltransferase family protein [Raoultella ornithinolytica]
MTSTLTITRERLEKIKSWRETYGAGSNVILPAEEAEELARMALSAMDSEPQTDDELSNLLWYSQEATCHSDPNYYCEFQRLATPVLIAGIIRELQERRKAAMDSEPVAWLAIYHGEIYDEAIGITRSVVEAQADHFGWELALTEIIPLYRHAQSAPVVPTFEEWCKRTEQKPQGWVRDAMKEAYDGAAVAMLQAGNSPVIPDGYVMVPKEPTQAMCAAFNDSDYGRKSLRERYVAMLAAAPQEVK